MRRTNTYGVPGIVESPLHNSFISHNNPESGTTIILTRRDNRGTEGLRDLPTVPNREMGNPEFELRCVPQR